MRVTWTDQQRAVIAARDRDILVSAAAGSGKTTVLTERIFDRINDREHPIHVDDLLIVTFTEAAARQMRSKIRDRLTQAIGEQSLSEEERSRLREQLIRLPQAQISTIHGFCLEIIRNWFHVIDLDPDFRICVFQGPHSSGESLWILMTSMSFMYGLMPLPTTSQVSAMMQMETAQTSTRSTGLQTFILLEKISSDSIQATGQSSSWRSGSRFPSRYLDIHGFDRAEKR